MTNETQCGVIALIGPPNAGKSTLVNMLLGQKIVPVCHKAQTTQRAVRAILSSQMTQYIFIDTPGVLKARHGLQHFMAGQAEGALESVDCAALVVDAAVMLHKAHEILPDVEAVLKNIDKSKIVVVLNKVDLIKDKEQLLAVLELLQKMGYHDIVPVSAQKNTGLDRLLKVIETKLPKAPFVFDPELLSDAAERDLARELIREKVLELTHEEVPYQVAVTIEHFDEARRNDAKKPLVHISANLHVAADSQKAIILGKGGSKIKAIGQSARKDLEALLGVQVMLELFVRVEKDWMNQRDKLRKLGY